MGFEAEWVLDAGTGDEHVPATSGPGYGMDRLIEVSDYCRDLLSALDAQSLEVRQLHPEYAPAQFELSLGPADPVGPYLLVGAVLALGLAGMRRGMRLPPEVTVDPATLSEEELAALGASPLPHSLAQALEHFRRCAVLAEAMGPSLFETIIAVRETELRHFAGASEEEIVSATRFRY